MKDPELRLKQPPSTISICSTLTSTVGLAVSTVDTCLSEKVRVVSGSLGAAPGKSKSLLVKAHFVHFSCLIFFMDCIKTVLMKQAYIKGDRIWLDMQEKGERNKTH